MAFPLYILTYFFTFVGVGGIYEMKMYVCRITSLFFTVKTIYK